LITHVASRAAGFSYCISHTAGSARRSGIDDTKLDAVWEYRTSPLYTEAERIAFAAGHVPNGVTDEMFTKLRKH
jgi:alkylhydroperoxidase family enzyme